MNTDVMLAALDNRGPLATLEIQQLGKRKVKLATVQAKIDELVECGRVKRIYRRGKTRYEITEEGRQYIQAG